MTTDELDRIVVARGNEQATRDRVAKGAALLDTKIPGWASRINPGALDMGDVDRCIVGQLATDELPDESPLRYTRLLATLITETGEASAYGFDGDLDAGVDYPDLAVAWHREIFRRTV